MQKSIIWTMLIILAVVPVVSATETILDEFPADSLGTWNQYDSGYNPIVTRSEITSPYDGTTAFKQEVSGNTVMYCDTKYMWKEFDVGNANAQSSALKAYVAFTYDGTYYNFPYVTAVLYDQNDVQVGSKVFYGNGIIGGYYQNIVAGNPSYYGELPGTAGYYTMDLSSLGNIDFSKIAVYISDYTCIGQNSLVMDHLVFQNGAGNEDGNSVPEFTGAAFVMVGALTCGFIISKRRKN